MYFRHLLRRIVAWPLDYLISAIGIARIYEDELRLMAAYLTLILRLTFDRGSTIACLDKSLTFRWKNFCDHIWARSIPKTHPRCSAERLRV